VITERELKRRMAAYLKYPDDRTAAKALKMNPWGFTSWRRLSRLPSKRRPGRPCKKES